MPSGSQLTNLSHFPWCVVFYFGLANRVGTVVLLWQQRFMALKELGQGYASHSPFDTMSVLKNRQTVRCKYSLQLERELAARDMIQMYYKPQ